MTGIIRQPDGTGHTEVKFDTDVPESIEVAMEMINRALAAHSLLFDTSTKPGTPIKEFNPSEHEHVTIIPAFQGG